MRLNCCVDCDDYEEDSCTKDHLLINFRKRDKNGKDVEQLRGLLDVGILEFRNIEQENLKI